MEVQKMNLKKGQIVEAVKLFTVVLVAKCIKDFKGYEEDYILNNLSEFLETTEHHPAYFLNDLGISNKFRIAL